MSNDLAGRRALVTGAGGFVGVNLCAHLAAHGAEVHGTVRPESQPGSHSTWRLPALREAATVHEVDLAGSGPGGDLDGLLESVRPEVVFHAAVRSAYDREAGLASWVADGVLTLARLLDAAAGLPRHSGQAERPRVVQLGSFLVHGPRSEDVPLSASDPFAPDSPRGAVKAAAARIGAAGARELGVPFVELRLFTVYGPWEAPHRLVPTALRAAREGGEVPLTPPGLRRDLVYVEDVAEACRRAGFAEGFEPLDGRAIPVGSGVETANEEVIRAVEEATGRPVRTRPGAFPPRATDSRHCRADLEPARSLLGWEPRHSLIEGLRKTAEWLEEMEARACDPS